MPRPILARRAFLAGVAAAAVPRPGWATLPNNPDVVVIGAGAAGLATAQALRTRGLQVAILEARGRIGGRAHTDHETFGVPYDRGCHWLHVAHLNPWVDYARQNGFTVYPDAGARRLYVDGRACRRRRAGGLSAGLGHDDADARPRGARR